MSQRSSSLKWSARWQWRLSWDGCCATHHMQGQGRDLLVRATVNLEAPALPSRSRHLVVSAMGITQVLAWGSSYYLPAVLAAPIAADTGWSLPAVVAGLSCGLLLAGVASPVVGRTIQRWGGRPVLAGSSVLLAVGL